MSPLLLLLRKRIERLFVIGQVLFCGFKCLSSRDFFIMGMYTLQQCNGNIMGLLLFVHIVHPPSYRQNSITGGRGWQEGNAAQDST